MHTACVSHQPWRARWLPASALASERPDLWSEKTTVCRIFSCQRSSGGIAPRTLTVVGMLPPPPLAHSLAGPQSPTPFARVRRWNVGSVAARPTFLSYGSRSRVASRTVKFLLGTSRSLENRPEFNPSLLRGGAKGPRRAQMPEAFANQNWWRIPGSNR